MANEEGHVTRRELKVKLDQMEGRIERNISSVEERLEQKISLAIQPIAFSSEATAANTAKTTELLEKFVDSQQKTNDRFFTKLHDHDVKFTGIKGQFDAVGLQIDAAKEDKSNNTKVIIGALSVIAAIIGGIFGLAPYVFGQ